MTRINFFFLLSIALTWSCANRVQPTGGPKDTDPPEVIYISPEPGQRNFRGQVVIFEFNEYVTLNNLKEELIITPRISGDYTYKIKRRAVYLVFDEPFADSTTYTLNFREGITDITEKNPATDLQLAFSTVELLDTLTLSGSVVNLMTKKPADNTTVGLYPIADTLDIFSGPPYYFTKTNKAGAYTFRNIKDGEYKLYAFKDDNKDLVCQSDREAYAYLTHTIYLDTALIADTLELYNLNIDTLKISRTRVSGRYFLVSANKYITRAKLQAANDSTLVYKFDDDHKGLKIYQTFAIKDSLPVYATVYDSLGMVAQDTFYLQFPETTRKPDAFKVSMAEPKASKTLKKLSGTIKFNKPLQQFLIDSLAIKKDSLANYPVGGAITYTYDTLENLFTYTVALPQQLLDSLTKKPMNKDKAKAALTGGFNRGNTMNRATPTTGTGKKSYTVFLPKGTIISVENDTANTLNKQIKFTEATQTGLLTGNITTDYKSYVVQLLDGEFNMVQEQKNVARYTFREITPGEYYLRILVDENENGKWDPGDIRQNIPPEKVIVYHDEEGNSKTAIRANWEVTIDLAF